MFAVAAHAHCPHYAPLGIVWLHPLPLKLTEDRKNKQTNQPRKKKYTTEIWQSYGMQRNHSNLISENGASP